MRKSMLLLTSLIAISSAHADTLTLDSNSILQESSIPSLYSCDGKNISPQLSWSGAPKKTATFALLVSDPDAPSGIFYHWVVFNIPATTTSFNDGALLNNPIVVGKNSWNNNTYKGPCPPKGSTHHYIFSLYALDQPLSLAADATAENVLKAMQNHVLDESEIKATFGH